jgi:nucleotide-binding universal stress UspA family protein
MELAESKKVKLETVLERGTIYAKIIETALDREADLIVVGGRRVGMADGPGSRDLLSSEYAKVLRESPVSVLVAKSEEIEKEFRGF